MNTSYMVGFVLARSSVGSSNDNGLKTKNIVEAIILMPVIRNRLVKDFLSSAVSLIPNARPTPIIGPISGEISIAPIITGMELTLSPTLAITMAMARIHTLGPLKATFETMADCAEAMSI